LDSPTGFIAAVCSAAKRRANGCRCPRFRENSAPKARQRSARTPKIRKGSLAVTENINIVSLGPGFAAEVRGVSLKDVATNDAAYKQVRAAFEQHSVLVFRGEDTDNAAQLAYTRRFGEPEVVPVGTAGMGGHFITLSNFGADGKVVALDHRYALRNKANQLWHTDSSFKATPALASILSARIVPTQGGETEFVSMRLAFEKFDGALQEKLEHSFAWHDYSHSKGKIAPGLASQAEREAFPPVCWRMVWRNPANGRRALYLASHAKTVEGMDAAAGAAWIDELTAAATPPGASYLHAWKTGDVVMWDNRATMHRGRPWPGAEARLMVRTTVSASAADGLETMRPPSRQAAE
jgi:alpha-ketoglutarate-dependent 2,4-dichlorophenoxyacetate dioxygenase